MITLQNRIQTLLNSFVSEGKERGLQVAAYLNGQLVVNAWVGVADARTGRKVEERTLFPVFSTTKGIAATLAHLLAERGQLSYDEPIATYWPEFAAHGKERITVRQALNHSAGIPQMPRVTYEQMCHWDTICAAVADLTPLWPPGTRIEYHPKTFGWIIGEVLHRADGRPFAKLMRDEICAPLGIDTMFVGIPDEVESQIAIIEEPDAKPPPPDDGKPQTILSSMGPLYAQMNRPDVLRTCMPSSNGVMNAVAIARHYAALIPGGVDGVELLPQSRVDIATEPQRPALAENEDYPKGWGLGYGIGTPGSVYGESGAGFGHAGFGGSIGFADRDMGLAFGLTKNLFSPGDTTGIVAKELRAAIRELH